MASDARRQWERQAAERAAAAGGRATPEDELLRALIAGGPDALASAARLRASAELIDQDYLAYWVDLLALQERWRALEEIAGREDGSRA